MFVRADDCSGLLGYLERCVATQRTIGRSIAAAGLISFESRMAVVRRIYATGLANFPALSPEDASLLAFVDTASASDHIETLSGILPDLGYEDDFDLHELLDDDDPDEEEPDPYDCYDEDRDEWLDPSEDDGAADETVEDYDVSFDDRDDW